MNSELRNCPFCGGKDPSRCNKIDGSGVLPESFQVFCCWCGATIEAITQQIADAYWNRRTPEQPE